jgi:PTS system nitrogen regulatory IIA component
MKNAGSGNRHAFWSLDMHLKVRDAAELLGVSTKTIYRWIEDKKLPVHHIGDQYRFERAELFEFAIQERLRPSPRLLQEMEAQDPATAGDCLENGGIYYRVDGRTKRDVLENALKMIKGIERAAMESLLEMFLAREQLASTGIGDGIAIPHTRTPLVGYVARPLLSLAFLETPLDYGALDGKPVQALFLLVSPTIRSHLAILGRLSFALKDHLFRQAVLRRETRQKILSSLRAIEARIPDTMNISHTH